MLAKLQLARRRRNKNYNRGSLVEQAFLAKNLHDKNDLRAFAALPRQWTSDDDDENVSFATAGAIDTASSSSSSTYHDDDDDDESCVSAETGKRDLLTSSLKVQSHEKGSLRSSFYDATGRRGSAASFESEPSSNKELGKRSCRSKVEFSTVSVNYHPIILGDNPSVSSGPPLTIAWDAVCAIDFDISFESHFDDDMLFRRPRRGKELKIAQGKRENMLLRLGFGWDDIRHAEKQLKAIQESRQAILDCCEASEKNHRQLQQRTHGYSVPRWLVGSPRK